MAIPRKNISIRSVIINYIVANILAVDNPVPSPVLSITMKQVNPAKLATMLPNTLSILLPIDKTM